MIRERPGAPATSTATTGPVAVPVPASFERLRPLIDAGLRNAVERLSPSIANIAAYHLGWQDADGRATHVNGGKAVRPTITLLAAEASGAEAAAALPGAVAIELVHNFSLLHDDVMDGDRERRHRATVWAMFGVGQAIVVGDALLALAEFVLLDDGRPEAHQAAAELTRATEDMIRGQAEDLAFESRLDVTVDEALAMTGWKTAALLSSAAAMGGILAGASSGAVEALRAFGRHLGLAFQAVDDVLGIWGDPAITGKPAANDLRQHKKSLPVAHALSTGGVLAQDVARALSNGQLGDQAVAGLADRLDEAGSRRWTLAVAGEHLAAAMEALGHPDLRGPAVAELEDIAVFVVRRDF
jgi:geranylgeranyl diphosphate synthase type I